MKKLFIIIVSAILFTGMVQAQLPKLSKKEISQGWMLCLLQASILPTRVGVRPKNRLSCYRIITMQYRFAISKSEYYKSLLTD